MPRTPPDTPINVIANIFTLGRPPASDLQFSTLQGQYFQVFQEHTASELSGFFDSAITTPPSKVCALCPRKTSLHNEPV